MKKIISIFTIMLLFVAYTQAQTKASGNEDQKVEQVTPVKNIDANSQSETQGSSSMKSCSSKKMMKSCCSKSSSAMKNSSHCTDKSKAVGSEQSSEGKTEESDEGMK
jgi:hypothetical protein